MKKQTLKHKNKNLRNKPSNSAGRGRDPTLTRRGSTPAAAARPDRPAFFDLVGEVETMFF